ncbi:diacylglycerol/lipid kinase family protein [Chloroflexota bacterium]
MTRYKIIVNPISGRGYAKKTVPMIEKYCNENGLNFDLVLTEEPWQAAEFAENAALEGYDVVISASGDGTANEVLNGLMRARGKGAKNSAMGIIAVGTGNDFAYGMKIPGNFEDCMSAIKKDVRKTMDIGMVKGGDYPEGRYFGNGVGIGFDAAVGFEAVKIQWTRGLLAYLIAALRTIFLYYKAPMLEITFDDQKINQNSLMTSIMNGQRMGGGFYMAPGGDPADGVFDLCIAASASKLRIFQLITYFMKGTQATQEEVKTAHAKSVKIKALEGTLPAHCDGETLCFEGTELRIEILPGQMEFVVGE